MKNIILAIFITICLIFVYCGQEQVPEQKETTPTEEIKEQSTPIYSVSVSELAASSFLKDENNYFRYHPWKALDGDPTSAWNEAAEGAGQGEYLQIVFDKKIIIDKLTIMPGYYDAQWYSHNNRIKKLTLYLDDYSLEVELSDVMENKEIIIPKAQSFYTMKIEIKDVYPGTSYNDTCVSEVNFFYEDKEIELLVERELAEFKEKEAIGNLPSPAGKVCTTIGPMGIGYSEYFFKDGIYVSDHYRNHSQAKFHMRFGTWKFNKNDMKIDIHITLDCYVEGIGQYESNIIVFAYKEYEFVETKVDHSETTDWNEYIYRFEEYNISKYGMIFKIDNIKDSDYDEMVKGYKTKAYEYIEKNKALYNKIIEAKQNEKAYSK